MITWTKIDLGKDLGSSQLIKQNINAGKRIFIFDSNHIERPVINTQPQVVIFLLYKQGRATPW